MNRRASGFGLIEIMVAISLGLLIGLGLTQLLFSSKATYLSQSASAALQEDARLVLSRMIQDIRSVGLSGCLAKVDDMSTSGGFSRARDTSIKWDAAQQTLSLITADMGRGLDAPTWIVISDCETSAVAYNGKSAPRLGPGQLGFPVREVRYVYNSRNQEIRLGTQPLIDNVSAFSVLFGVADHALDAGIARYTVSPPDLGLVRSVRLSMTLTDPQGRVKSQTFSVTAALRNRLG